MFDYMIMCEIIESFIHLIKLLSKNPLFVAIVQVILGAGLLSWWSYRRDQRTSRRQEAIKFIEEIANLLNEPLSSLFFIVRHEDFKQLKNFYRLVGHLYGKRLSIRVKSQSLLGTRDFSQNYEDIMYQLDKCRKALKLYYQSQDVNKTIQEIEKAIPSSDINDLRLWANAKGNQTPPWGYFYVWAEWIWSTSDYLLAEALNSTINNKSKFKLPLTGSLQQKDRVVDI